MKVAIALGLLGIAVPPLVRILIEAGLSCPEAIRAVTVPLFLAAAAGAVMWSWAEPRARGRS